MIHTNSYNNLNDEDKKLVDNMYNGMNITNRDTSYEAHLVDIMVEAVQAIKKDLDLSWDGINYLEKSCHN